MPANYSEFLAEIIERDLKISKPKKEILQLLLAHWSIDKEGLSAQDIQDTMGNVMSVIYGHIHTLEDKKLIHTFKKYGVLRASINIDALEEIRRQERNKDTIKAKIIEGRSAKNTTTEK